TALGIGLGSPLAGYLSGGKVEVGLIPLGGLGMILATLLASLAVGYDLLAGLIVGLISIGFFTGFYIVPMFTLLQHRAPKASKGDLLATSNFVNVVGAIGASVLFRGLVLMAAWVGITPSVQPDLVARGTLTKLEKDPTNFSRPASLEVLREDGSLFTKSSSQRVPRNDQGLVDRVIIESEGTVQPSTDEQEGSEVIVGRYSFVRQGHKVW